MQEQTIHGIMFMEEDITEKTVLYILLFALQEHQMVQVDTTILQLQV
jgi:hypothetical protein